jgi:alpha-glucosidase
VQRTDPASTLSTLRAAIAVRRQLRLGAIDLPVEWIDTDAPDVLAFRRGDRFSCVTDFGAATTTWDH